MSSTEQEDFSGVRPSAPITGFVDMDPQQQYLFNQWLKKVALHYERFGFTPLHLRPFERLSALNGEGETQKQIFEVFRADTGQTTSLALPFDHTVPLALWVAEHAGRMHTLSFPYKRYDLSLSFRGERPKTGRFRAFVQADVDIIGRKLNLSADVEGISAIMAALSSLSIGPFKMKLNHIHIVKSILNKQQIPLIYQPAVLRAIDKLDKLSVEQVAAEICKVEGLSLSSADVDALLVPFTTPVSLSDPALVHMYGEESLKALEQLRQLLELLRRAGMNLESFIFSPGMVRGLAYYTGIVAETFLVGKEQFGSIASGGRYSNLVGSFADTLQDVEGVGFSIGLTRLFDILCKTDLSVPKRTTVATVLVGSRTEELTLQSYELGSRLRQLGLNVDVYSGGAKVKNILSHANTLGLPFTALVMDEKVFVIKEMVSQVQTEFTTIEEACQFLANQVSHHQTII